jgi:hypothetical protein
MYVYLHLKARCCNHCCRGYILWACVCSLRHSHAMPCYLWPARLYNIFFTLSHKELDFRGGGGALLNIKSVFWFCPERSSETFLILRRNERDTKKKVYWSSGKVSVILADINGTLNLLNRFFEKSSKIKFHKSTSRGAELFHADVETDTTKIRFSQFCESA